MSRHKHRQADTGTAERVASLKGMRAELATAYGLPEGDVRIAQAAVVRLNQQNWEGQILLGKAVPSGELEAYTAVIERLLGKPTTTLRVEFVEPNLAFLSDTQLRELEALMAVATGRSPPTPEPSDERTIGPSEAAAGVVGRFIDANCEAWARRPLNADEKIVMRTHLEMMARGFSLRSLWDDVSARPSPSAQPPAAEPSPAPPSAPSPPEAGPAPAPTNVTPLRSVHDPAFAPLSRRSDEPWRNEPGEFRRFDVPENF